MSEVAKEIHLASKKGDATAVTRLLKSAKKSDLKFADARGWTALMAASASGHATIVEMLIDAGAVKNAAEENGCTALMLAANEGHANVVRVLIAAGADRTLTTKGGYTALAIAKTKDIKALLSSTIGTSTGKYCASKPVPNATESTPALLVKEGDLIRKQLESVPQRRELSKQLDAVQAQYDAAMVVADDFQLVAALGATMQALQQESAQLPLSEEDYLTLPARHAQLMQRTTDMCKELLAAKQYAALEELGADLETLRALEIPAVVNRNSEHAQKAAPLSPADENEIASRCTTLIASHRLLVEQVALAPQRAEMMQRLEAAQAQYDAAEAEGRDFRLIGSLGRALEALQLEAAQLPLSEEAYLTLTARHAELVQQLTETCRELASTRAYSSLSALGEKLKALQALDVSNFSQSGTSDPTLPPSPPPCSSPTVATVAAVEDEEDSANDPVLPPILPHLAER